MPRPYLQVLLALTVVAIVGYIGIFGTGPSSEVGAWQKDLPQTYLYNARTSSYNEEGALTDVLEAATASFYPSKKESVIEFPKLYSHNIDDDSWSASADSGRFDNRREILILTDNVSLVNDTNAVELSTERMKIDFRKNMATSRVPVTITNGPNSTRADGMIADLDTQTVRLQSNVESIYVKSNP